MFYDEFVYELATTTKILLGIAVIRMTNDAYMSNFLRTEISHPLYCCREVSEWIIMLSFLVYSSLCKSRLDVLSSYNHHYSNVNKLCNSMYEAFRQSLVFVVRPHPNSPKYQYILLCFCSGIGVCIIDDGCCEMS